MVKNIKKTARIAEKSRSSSSGCHDGNLQTASLHPDHSKQVARINRINGQMEAVKRMIVEQRYCPEIIVQTRAIYSAVRSLEASILEKHLQSCVKDAMRSKNSAEAEQKIQELMDLFNRV